MRNSFRESDESVTREGWVMNPIANLVFQAFWLAAVVILCTGAGCSNDSKGQGAGQSRYADEIKAHGGELQIHLDFSDTELTDADLSSLPLPSTVRSISLRGTKITDRGVEELKRAENLERVDLRNTQITDQALEVLMQLPRLWDASLGSPNLSQEEQQKLLRHLSRRSSQIPYDTSHDAQPMTGPPR